MSADEIRFYLELADASCKKIVESESGKELRVAWEEFIAHFSRAVGRMINFSEKDIKTRIWSHQLKNASIKDDEGLVFLREARNATEHALEPFAIFRDRGADIGGFIRLEGTSSITMSNNFVVVDGISRPMGDFTMRTVDGRIDSIAGRPNVTINENPSQIVLRPIVSAEKKKTYHIPATVLGIRIDTTKPEDMAICAMTGLKSKFHEMLQLQK